MIALLLALLANVDPISVPDGRYVLVNGLIAAGEWDGSARVVLDAETQLLARKDRDHLFLAIVFKGPRHTGVDLYLRTKGLTRMLHVSSALGERTREGGSWSAIAWGRNSWWTANTIGMVAEDGQRRFLEPDAFEFQIARTALGDAAELFVHLKRPEKRLPAGASETADGGWARLLLK